MTDPAAPEAHERSTAALQLIGSDTEAGRCTDETCHIPDGTDQLIARSDDRPAGPPGSSG